MFVFMGFNAFGTRLQSLWIFFFARKDIPCGVKNRMLDEILFRQLPFSFCLQHVTLTYVFAGFCQSTFSTFTYTFQRLNNKIADQTAPAYFNTFARYINDMRNVLSVSVNCRMIE